MFTTSRGICTMSTRCLSKAIFAHCQLPSTTVMIYFSLFTFKIYILMSVEKLNL